MTEVLLTEATHISTLDLIHRRLGHLGVDMIKFMSEKECYSKRIRFKVKESDFRKTLAKI